MVGAVSAAPSGLLNDTGQTQCLNVTGTALEECTPENSGDDSPYPGQDGRYGRDAAAKYPAQSGFTKPEGSGGQGGFAFTPLDVNGNPIPLVGDPPVPTKTPRCVWDRVTNLIWEVKTDDGGLQDKDWVYFGGDSGGGIYCNTGSNCNIKYYIDAINAASICQIGGAGDWRLPTRHELLSIVNYGLNNPAIETAFFPNTQSNYYYTSDKDDYLDQRWFVGFYEGNTTIYTNSAESNQYYVRVVRNGPENNAMQKSFTDNGDGTITDNLTGLIWDQCSWGEAWGAGLPAVERLLSLIGKAVLGLR